MLPGAALSKDDLRRFICLQHRMPKSGHAPENLAIATKQSGIVDPERSLRSLNLETPPSNP